MFHGSLDLNPPSGTAEGVLREVPSYVTAKEMPNTQAKHEELNLSWRLWKKNFEIGKQVAVTHSSTGGAIQSSLLLQSNMAVEAVFAVAFALWTVVVIIFKNVSLPSSLVPAVYRGTEEILLLLLYLVVQPLRLYAGYRGNICEDERALGAFIVLTNVTLCVHGYFATRQAYVLHADYVFNLAGIAQESIGVVLACVVTVRSARSFRTKECATVLGGTALCVVSVVLFL